MLSVSRNEAVPLKTMRAGMPWDWVTYPEFLDSVDRTPKGVNVMSLVPLAPLYGYVVGVDKAKEQRASDDELDEMCQLLVEAMDAGGWAGARRSSGDVVQRAARLRRHADGHRRDDRTRDRRLLARPRELGRGSTQITGALETAALIARESGRPIVWNALGADRFGEPARRVAVPAPRDHRPPRPAEPGGRAAGLRVGPDRAVQVGDRARGLQPHGHLPGVEGRVPRHARREDRQVRRPGAPTGTEGSDRRDRAADSAPPGIRSTRSRSTGSPATPRTRRS